MAQITEKTVVSLGIVVLLITGLTGAAWRLSNHETRIEKQEERDDRIVDAIKDLRHEVSEVKTNGADTNAHLAKLEGILEGGIKVKR